MANSEGPEEFIVISLTASLPGQYVSCSVIGAGDPFLGIFSKVFGPDSRKACEEWVAANCGGIGI